MPSIKYEIHFIDKRNDTFQTQSPKKSSNLFLCQLFQASQKFSFKLTQFSLYFFIILIGTQFFHIVSLKFILQKNFNQMEENDNLKRYDENLKKYIEKSIHRKQLIDCSSFMTKKRLNFFYQQLEDHLYEKNLKKINHQRRFSVGNQQVMNLEEKKCVKMITHPQCLGSGKANQKSIETGHNKKGLKQKSRAFDIKQTTKQRQKSLCQQQINYYVRNIKNPKAIRYIQLKPSHQINPKPPFLSTTKPSLKHFKQTKNTNFHQRTELYKQIKKNTLKRFRKSCIEF